MDTKELSSSSVKKSTQCRLWLMEHYDAVVNQIDRFIEELILIEQSKPINICNNLNEQRIEAINLVRELERKTSEYLMENLVEFDALDHLDDIGLKRRLFGNNFCFVLSKNNLKTQKAKNLMLVVDSFKEQYLIDYSQLYLFLIRLFTTCRSINFIYFKKIGISLIQSKLRTYSLMR